MTASTPSSSLPQDRAAAPDPLVRPVSQPSSGPQGRERTDPAKRLPHERDESRDSQDSEPRPVIEQARKDVERGLKDTDRGTPMDALYKRTARSSGDPPDRGDDGGAHGDEAGAHPPGG